MQPGVALFSPGCKMCMQSRGLWLLCSAYYWSLYPGEAHPCLLPVLGRCRWCLVAVCHLSLRAPGDVPDQSPAFPRVREKLTKDLDVPVRQGTGKLIWWFNRLFFTFTSIAAYLRNVYSSASPYVCDPPGWLYYSLENLLFNTWKSSLGGSWFKTAKNINCKI